DFNRSSTRFYSRLCGTSPERRLQSAHAGRNEIASTFLTKVYGALSNPRQHFLRRGGTVEKLGRSGQPQGQTDAAGRQTSPPKRYSAPSAKQVLDPGQHAVDVEVREAVLEQQQGRDDDNA